MDAQPETQIARAPGLAKYPGKLIIVEGIDGSGKSTQLFLLSQWLKAQGYPVFFSEWNSSPLVKETTRRGKKKLLLTPTTFSLIHATDFANRYEQEILPALKAGFVVLADRYVSTAFARDVVRGVPPRWVRQVYAFAPKPDLAFYFRVPLDVALQRIMNGRAQLKYYEAGQDIHPGIDPQTSFRLFQGKILDEYERLTEEMHLTVVDAVQPIEVQQHQVREMVEPLLKGIQRPKVYAG